MNRDKNNTEEQEKKKKIIMIIILILLLLLLITSCTSKFWGSIGDWFQNEGNYEINDNTNDKDIVTNKNLKLDTDHVDVYLDDPKVKISYQVEGIEATNFSCTTSDANIATCYVQNDYIVINPKGVGNVKITLQAEANGKVYKATSTVTVKDGTRALKLSSYSGQINLDYNNVIYLTFETVGISGDIRVTSSDESVAKVQIDKNGAIEITGYRSGNAIITATIEYGGKVYTATYQLEVIGYRGNNPSNNGANGNRPSYVTDKNSYLSSLTISNAQLAFHPNIYYYTVGVGSDVSTVTLNYKTSSSKAHVSFTYNGKTVSSLNNLSLNKGDNTVIITVIAEDGSTSQYKVVINKASSSNNSLANLTVDKGVLSPNFDANTLNYTVNVGSDVDQIKITSSLTDSKSKVQYKVDGVVVDSLDEVKLHDGKNNVEIIVTSEDGTKRVYTVTINKALSDNNYLSNIIISDYELEPKFDKKTNDYQLTVSYNTDILSIVGIPEDERSQVKYLLDGKEVSLDDIKLVNKDSDLKIVVTSLSGKENTYQIHIHKKERTIKFNEEEHIIRMDQTSYKVLYKVFEDNEEIDDYSAKDIKVELANYKGKYEIHNGYILLIPDKDMASKTATMTAIYHQSKTTTNLKFIKDDYYLESYADKYTVKLENGTGYRDIIINSNLLTGVIKKENIPNGIRLRGEGDTNYIDLVTDRNIISVDLLDNAPTSSFAIRVHANGVGNASIKVTGYDVLGKVKELNIAIEVVAQHTLTLLANGGLFNDLGDQEYKIKVLDGNQVDLATYNKAYLQSETNDCEYFPIKSYNTKSDGSGTNYDLYDASKNEIKPVNVLLNNDLVLYAIYDKSTTVSLPQIRKFYVTDVPLFKNDEYYKLYNIEKMIYPGANGSYVMHMKNVSQNDIEIIGMTLEEETLCVPEGCLNMGYNVRYAPTGSSEAYHYYYGTHRDNVMKYKVLNHEFANPTKNNKKEISFLNTDYIPIYNDASKGQQEIEITLYWKWVDQQIDTDDALGNADLIDTLIGNSVTELNNKYKLILSFDYQIINDKCSNP